MPTVTGDSHQKIDAYIARLRKRLRGIDEQELREILEELRGHILDKSTASGQEPTAAAVDRTLASLGTPEQLAGEYLADNLLAQAEVSRSPLRIVQILLSDNCQVQKRIRTGGILQNSRPTHDLYIA